jgi:hypothetical protein
VRGALLGGHLPRLGGTGRPPAPPVAPNGSPYTHDQMPVASSPNKQTPLTRQLKPPLQPIETQENGTGSDPGPPHGAKEHASEVTGSSTKLPGSSAPTVHVVGVGGVGGVGGRGGGRWRWRRGLRCWARRRRRRDQRRRGGDDDEEAVMGQVAHKVVE